jgi:hypothetical protein
MISNMIEVVGEGDDRDLDLLDGYEELPQEHQEKLARALDQGHIDDEDWNGVSGVFFFLYYAFAFQRTVPSTYR